MASPVTLPRTLLIYVIVIPLALVVGYLLISPSDTSSFALLAFVGFVLCMPLLMRWHYSILLLSWNAAVSFYFLPGSPSIWVLAVMLSLGFTIVNHIINRQGFFVSVPSITWSLVFLTLVVLLTAKLRGGIGLRVLGSSSYGGKGYFYILAAIAGYFALTTTVIPPQRVRRTIGLFFLSGVTSAVGHLAYLAGPSFYFLYTFFPPTLAMSQAVAEITGQGMARYQGFALACLSVFSYLLARYGIRGTFNLSHPFRFLLVCLVLMISPIGGFRSIMASLGLTFIFVFLFEGLVRTKYLPLFLGCGILALGLLVPIAHHLPYQAQRALSFLPIDLDPVAKLDAESSTLWRVEMWKSMIPDLPHYALLGKGYTLNPTDLYMTAQFRRGGYEASLESGDYHSGPLSVYVPLGGVGTLAFLFFLIAAVRGLYLNYRYGDPALQTVNTFLLSLFLSRCVSFVFVFGSLTSELYQFTGVIGLSVALNGGVKKAPAPNYLLQAAPATA